MKFSAISGKEEFCERTTLQSEGTEQISSENYMSLNVQTVITL